MTSVDQQLDNYHHAVEQFYNDNSATLLEIFECGDEYIFISIIPKWRLNQSADVKVESISFADFRRIKLNY